MKKKIASKLNLNQLDIKNFENASLISQLIYLRDQKKTKEPMPGYDEVKALVGYFPISEYEIEWLLELDVSEEENEIRNLYCFGMWTGWDFEHVSNFKYEDIYLTRFLEFKQGIRRHASDVLPKPFRGSQEIFTSYTQAEVDGIMKKICQQAGFNFSELPFTSAKANFLYYSIFQENATFEEVRAAIHMPVLHF